MIGYSQKGTFIFTSIYFLMEVEICHFPFLTAEETRSYFS